MEIIHKPHHLIISNDKIQDDEVKELEAITLHETKTITTQKRTIKEKTYTSYLVGIPGYALDLIFFDFFDSDLNNNKSGYIALKKINNQVYKFLLVDELKPGIIKIDDIGLYDVKNQSHKITLPKKEIEYLQAYDKYLETKDYINNKFNKDFESATLTAHIFINIAPANDEELQKEVMIRFYTNIDDKFKHSLELLNDKMPDWFKLLTDVSGAFEPSTFY